MGSMRADCAELRGARLADVADVAREYLAVAHLDAERAAAVERRHRAAERESDIVTAAVLRVELQLDSVFREARDARQRPQSNVLQRPRQRVERREVKLAAILIRRYLRCV